MNAKQAPSPLRVAWFSAGVSSAVATKLVVNEIDVIIYTHIEDQHPDSMRFVRDCEDWLGMPIQVLQSRHKSVENVVRFKRYVNSAGWAPCTELLKRQIRKEWETENSCRPLVYTWGLDCSPRECARAQSIVEAMPQQSHRFPLIEQKIDKKHAHEILKASKIVRPKMYDLGYHNNNCVGCVKGGMGYWNKIRTDFPKVFEARAKLERDIGYSCIKGVFLDELDPERGRHAGPIVDDCGIMCELQAL